LKNKEAKNRAEKPISLNPLSLEDAVSGLLAVDPKPIKAMVAKKRKKPRKTRR
jgi:hypothetical protein